MTAGTQQSSCSPQREVPCISNQTTGAKIGSREKRSSQSVVTAVQTLEGKVSGSSTATMMMVGMSLETELLQPEGS